jgi:predicted DCC family thiol-disulfide oxidoreductase YuxK
MRVPSSTPSEERRPEWIFYDGTCGLCHRVVLRVLARDRDGSKFRFAPLQGPTFEREIPVDQRADRPDSVVVKTTAGDVLTRSEAIRHVARRLGGSWKIPGGLLSVAPSWVADLLYDGVAAVRNRLFRRPSELCPVVPDHLASRFDP